MATPDPQLHSFLVRRQHGHRDRLDLAVQPALPIQRSQYHRHRHLLPEHPVVLGILRHHPVSELPVPTLTLPSSVVSQHRH